MEEEEEFIREIIEYEKTYHRGRQAKRRKKYPSNKDIAEAIIEVTGGRISIDEIEDLEERVIHVLEEKEYFTGHVGGRRIERIVEKLVSQKRLRRT